MSALNNCSLKHSNSNLESVRPLSSETIETVQKYVFDPVVNVNIHGNDFAKRVAALLERVEKHNTGEIWKDQALAVAKCAGGILLTVGVAAFSVLCCALPIINPFLLFLPLVGFSAIFAHGAFISGTMVVDAVKEAKDIFRSVHEIQQELEQLDKCCIPENNVEQLQAIEDALNSQLTVLDKRREATLVKAKQLGTNGYGLEQFRQFKNECDSIQTAIADVEQLRQTLILKV